MHTANVLPAVIVTLIEPLVTIAILSILMGLIFPALKNAKESARSLQCMNNMRQIGLAMHMYGNEYNYFPPVYTDNTQQTNLWFGPLLGPYIKKSTNYGGYFSSGQDVSSIFK